MKRTKIEKTILLKLDRLGYWGGQHTSVENLPHGFPSHLKGKVKKIVKKLVRSELLIIKPKPDSLHVSLNPRKMDEIKQIINNKNYK